MENEHVVSGLVKKRAELAGLIQQHQDTLAKLLADVNTIDAAILMFAPGYVLETISPKQMPAPHAAMRGEITSLVLGILRDAGEPVPTEEITRRVMVARGLSPADKTLFKVMLQRVHSCLRNHRKHRRVRSTKSVDRKYSQWEVNEDNY
jgi:hypothetical protein